VTEFIELVSDIVSDIVSDSVPVFGIEVVNIKEFIFDDKLLYKNFLFSVIFTIDIMSIILIYKIYLKLKLKL